MKITDARVIVSSPGRNYVTLVIEHHRHLVLPLQGADWRRGPVGTTAIATTSIAVAEVFSSIWDCRQLITERLIDYIRTWASHTGGW